MAKVVIGMSGGVDSTAAALLLKEQGHDVLGVFLRLWKHSEKQADDDHFSKQIERLHFSAKQIDVPFIAVDARDQFRVSVVDYFVKSYRDGITPNPCFFCNRDLKWAVLLKIAKEKECDLAASGHYAQTQIDDQGNAHLYRGVDVGKDQSYVLSSLRQDQLQKIIFPLGNMTKTEVRAFVTSRKLRIASAEESQDICFLPEGDYGEFLRTNFPAVRTPGEIADIVTGLVVGEHQGLAFYTIGQRKGLGVYAPEPRYVVEKDVTNNRLWVGKKESLGRQDMVVGGVNWILTDAPAFPFHCQVEIRYHSRALQCVVTIKDDHRLHVVFENPVHDITPGQAAVFYLGREVVGSGIIDLFEGVGGSA